MTFDEQPVVRVSRDPEGGELDPWLSDVPAVQQVLRDGLDLPPGVTFLVGENGSGKSTLVEAIAMAYGLSPEGGTAFGRHETRGTESSLHRALVLQRGLGSGRWGFFLRAETMHGWFTYMDGHAGSRDPDFHAMSHGESFLAVLNARFDSAGFYCLDEPEAALSFRSSLTLVRTLHDVVAGGGQVLCATHSPLVASLPGAHLLETARGASVSRRGRTSTWSATGGPTSTRPCATCATPSPTTEPRFACPCTVSRGETVHGAANLG